MGKKKDSSMPWWVSRYFIKERPEDVVSGCREEQVRRTLRTFVEKLLHGHAGWSLAGAGCCVKEGPAAAEVFMLEGVSLVSPSMVALMGIYKVIHSLC
jgi:hypothetical protein